MASHEVNLLLQVPFDTALDACRAATQATPWISSVEEKYSALSATLTCHEKFKMGLWVSYWPVTVIMTVKAVSPSRTGVSLSGSMQGMLTGHLKEWMGELQRAIAAQLP